MTGMDASASRQRAPEPGLRVTLPASRGGLAWLLVLLVVGTFLAFQVGRQVYASWAINQEADGYRAQVQVLEEENAALQQELNYLQSDAYISAEARRIGTVGRPGEQVLIIPPGAAVDPPKAADEMPDSAPAPIVQWLELFFGH